MCHRTVFKTCRGSMGLIIKPDFCRRTIRAFVYLLHFRYGHSYAYRASRNAFIAENLRYGMYPWASEKYMRTCEREPARLHEKDALLCSLGRLNLYPYPLK